MLKNEISGVKSREGELKRNLFLVYTPFHILLALGIASSKRDEENHLVVVRNFADPEKLIGVVSGWGNKPFKNIISLPGDYDFVKTSKLMERWNRYYGVGRCCRDILSYAVKSGINEFYLFNEERPQSLCLLDYVSRRRMMKAYCGEDGAVTYNNYFGSKNWNYLFWGKLFYGAWWKNVPVAGTSDIFESIYVLYPNLVRPELQDKKKERIPLEGIFELSTQGNLVNYFANYDLALNVLSDLEAIILLPNSVILNKEPDYREIMIKLIEVFRARGKSIAVKYHPRDANIDFLSLRQQPNVHILNPAIPVEFIFLVSKKLKFVVSDSSTTLMSALWALNDCRVISLGELTSRKDQRFNTVLNSLGVLLPKSFKEVENILG